MTVARTGLALVLVDRPQLGLGAVPGDLHGTLLAFAPALVLCGATGTCGTKTDPAWRRASPGGCSTVYSCRGYSNTGDTRRVFVATILDL
jgi:hypothetical protein